MPTKGARVKSAHAAIVHKQSVRQPTPPALRHLNLEGVVQGKAVLIRPNDRNPETSERGRQEVPMRTRASSHLPCLPDMRPLTLWPPLPREDEEALPAILPLKN